MYGTGWVVLIVVLASLALLAAVHWVADERRLLLASTVVIAATAMAFAAVHAPRSGSCNELRKSFTGQGGGQQPADTRAQPAAPEAVGLELAPDSDTKIDFGRRRQFRQSSVFLQRGRSVKNDPMSTAPSNGSAALQSAAGAAQPSLPEPGTSLVVETVGFERDKGDFQLGQSHVWATAVVRRNQEGVKLNVCVDPSGVPAGTYKGSVVFDDSRVSAGAVQWTVTVQYEKWWLVGLGALLAAAAAFFYSYVTASEKPTTVHSYARAHLIGIGAGLGTATIAFVGAYSGTPDWGASPDDWLKGAGVVFAAFTTGFIAQRMRLPTTDADKQAHHDEDGA